ncbi:MAG: sulfotransferase domain-containing protein [Bacteroidota bacterium]
MNKDSGTLKSSKKIKWLCYGIFSSALTTIGNLLISLKNKMETKKFLYELSEEGKEKEQEDIYISTYMKSGTTWMQMIIYQMITNGEMNFKHINAISPWIDNYNAVDSMYESKTVPRIFKTHLEYNYFPSKVNGKFICVFRNGMDVAVSQFYHIKDWGEPDLSFAKSYDEHFNSSWFKYSKQWLENKNNHKILLVKYEDLKKDLRQEIYRIANFCQIKLDESELPRILERSSFAFMKRHEDKFGLEVHRFNYKNFIRSGKINSSRSYFGEEQIDSYCENFNKYLSKFDYLTEYRAVIKES